MAAPLTDQFPTYPSHHRGINLARRNERQNAVCWHLERAGSASGRTRSATSRGSFPPKTSLNLGWRAWRLAAVGLAGSSACLRKNV
jgi:hypothetical protein